MSPIVNTSTVLLSTLEDMVDSIYSEYIVVTGLMYVSMGLWGGYVPLLSFSEIKIGFRPRKIMCVRFICLFVCFV